METVRKLSELVKDRGKTMTSQDPALDTKHDTAEVDKDASRLASGAEYNSASTSKVQLPNAPIASSSALLSWLEDLKAADAATGTSGSQDSSGSAASIARYRSSLAGINASLDQTSNLLSQLEQARINVSELKAGVLAVEETSEELREESERRGGRSESLLALASQLDVYLSYYSLLPSATTFLSSPSLSLVVTPQFNLTMEQLDVGLRFILAHPHFKDSGLYKLRFEHCITRGGSLARMWLVGRLKEFKDETVSRLKEREKNLKGREISYADEEGSGSEMERELLDLSSPALLQVLYSKMLSAAPELRAVLFEIQKRCPPTQTTTSNHKSKESITSFNEDSLLADYTHEGEDQTNGEAAEANPTFPEFVTLLSDCRTAYFDARRSILATILPSLLHKIEVAAQKKAQNGSSTSPLILSAGQSLGLLRSLLLSEGILYREIFGSSNEPQVLIDFLKSVSKDVLDRLHPRIFAEAKVSILAAVANVVLEASDLEENGPCGYLLFSLADPYDFGSVPARYRLEDAVDRSSMLLQPLIIPLFTDILTRLAFRSRAVLGGPDIGGYHPRTSEEITELLKRTVESGRGRLGSAAPGLQVASSPSKGRRGRSSLGVGVLEAAARRALEEAERETTTSGRASSQIKATTIELFAPPPGQVLATWYVPLRRAFNVLSWVHPIMNRSDFAKVGIEAIGKARGSLLNLKKELDKRKPRIAPSESQNGEETSSILDVPLWYLRQVLVLREISASVDLSLVQLSKWDNIEQDGAQEQPSGGSLLDLGAITRVVNGLLEGIGMASGEQAKDSNATTSASTTSSHAGVLAQDVSQASASLVAVLMEQVPASDKGIEEMTVGLRKMRRHMNLFIEDEEMVKGLLRAVIEKVIPGAEQGEMRAKLKEALGM